MDFTGPIIAFLFIIVVVSLLLKKYNPHAVLLFSGLIMMMISWFLNYDIDSLLKLESLENKLKIGFKSSSGESNTFNNILDFLSPGGKFFSKFISVSSFTITFVF